jgi:hypothetical protein
VIVQAAPTVSPQMMLEKLETVRCKIRLCALSQQTFLKMNPFAFFQLSSTVGESKRKRSCTVVMT